MKGDADTRTIIIELNSHSFLFRSIQSLAQKKNCNNKKMIGADPAYDEGVYNKKSSGNLPMTNPKHFESVNAKKRPIRWLSTKMQHKSFEQSYCWHLKTTQKMAHCLQYSSEEYIKTKKLFTH
jgi:hypothetical protein